MWWGCRGIREGGYSLRPYCPYCYWSGPLWASISVRLNLSCSTTSSRSSSNRLQRNCSAARLLGFSSHLSISNTLLSSVLSRTSNLSSLAWAKHSRLPSNWTSPGSWHSPSEKRVLPYSHRGHGSALWSSYSAVGMKVRSFRSGRWVPRRLTETRPRRPESRGEANPILWWLRPQ
jgi:hypothetical protein